MNKADRYLSEKLDLALYRALTEPGDLRQRMEVAIREVRPALKSLGDSELDDETAAEIAELADLISGFDSMSDSEVKSLAGVVYSAAIELSEIEAVERAMRPEDDRSDAEAEEAQRLRGWADRLALLEERARQLARQDQLPPGFSLRPAGPRAGSRTPKSSSPSL